MELFITRTKDFYPFSEETLVEWTTNKNLSMSKAVFKRGKIGKLTSFQMKSDIIKCKQCKKYCKRYGHLGIFPHIKRAKNCLKYYKGERFAELEQAIISNKEEFLKDYRQRKKFEIKRKHKYSKASAIRSYGLDNYMMKCKNCKNQFERYGSNGLLHHIKVERNCLQFYTADEISGLEELEVVATKTKKKKKKAKVLMEIEK